ncbi:MAG: M23 family metallopeptidase [Nitrospirota bacterium]
MSIFLKTGLFIKHASQKIIALKLRWKMLLVSLTAVAGLACICICMQQGPISFRIITQAHIAEAWKAAGLEMAEHSVRHKENFWRIARVYGVDIDTIIGMNPELGKLTASLGQTIRVSNKRGVLHRTEERENVQTLADLYQVSAEGILQMNNIMPDDTLQAGLEVFIPGAKPKKLSSGLAAHYMLRGIFASPLPGRITSGMGMRKHPVGGFRGKHTGIDLSARENTSIAAAAGGTVMQTGEGDYIGKFVIIAHKDSYTTVYGHCSRVLTAPGKTVKKGQIIAKSGSTGRVTGPHLHFEIRKNGIPQNPLNYLW